MSHLPLSSLYFFFNDPATTAIYTLSLHDALPILFPQGAGETLHLRAFAATVQAFKGDESSPPRTHAGNHTGRSEEHTSELQSLRHLVCRLLLEKKKNKTHNS